MIFSRSFAATFPFLAPLFQAADGGSSIPWWVWLVIIAVILLILFIGLVLLQEPGPPIPKVEDEPEVAPQKLSVKTEPQVDQTSSGLAAAGKVDEAAEPVTR